MRLKSLPNSVPVLESLLRAAEQFLEANNYPDRVWDRVQSAFPRDRKRSIAEIFTWHDQHKFIDDMYREAELRRPACMDFLDYVDWPFSWKASEHEGLHSLGFIRAADAYLERQWWMSRHDPPPENMPRDVALRFVRDVRAKLEQIERKRGRIHQEVTTQPQEAPTKKAKKKRDQGKFHAAYGAYMAHIANMTKGKVIGSLPTSEELAKQVGCSKTTAWRAIKDVERMRKRISKKDASSRYTGRAPDEDEDG